MATPTTPRRQQTESRATSHEESAEQKSTAWEGDAEAEEHHPPQSQSQSQPTTPRTPASRIGLMVSASAPGAPGPRTRFYRDDTLGRRGIPIGRCRHTSCNIVDPSIPSWFPQHLLCQARRSRESRWKGVQAQMPLKRTKPDPMERIINSAAAEPVREIAEELFEESGEEASPCLNRSLRQV